MWASGVRGGLDEMDLKASCLMIVDGEDGAGAARFADDGAGPVDIS